MSVQSVDTYNDGDTSWVEELSKKKDKEKLTLQYQEEPHTHVRTQKTKFTKFLAFLVVAAVAAIVVLAVKLRNANQDRGEVLRSRSLEAMDSKEDAGCDKTECTTPACVLAASYIIKSMDQHVDPCEDFYEFACGGWMKSRELPSDTGHYAAYSILRDDVSLKIKGLLEEEDDEDITAVKKVKDMYQSCVNEELIEEVNTTGYIRLLTKLGGWPLLGCIEGGRWSEKMYDLMELIVDLQIYNNVPLISVWVGMDDKNNSRNGIFIDQIWLGMSTIEFYTDETHTEKKEAYRTMIYNTAVLLGSTADDLDKQVDDVVEFETKLAKILTPASQRRDMTTLYNPITIADLQDQYTNPVNFPNVKFDWLSFLQTTVGLSGETVNITVDEEVVLQGPGYYKHLFPLLNTTSPKTIANYMIWRITKNRLNNLPIRFRDEVFKYNKAVFGYKSLMSRWKVCIRYLKSPFQMVLGRLFVERYFGKESKTEVLDMINNIRAAFKDMVNTLDWMDSDMKEVAKEKADYIVEVIGYPDYLFNDDEVNEMYDELTIDADTYFENILTVLQYDGRESMSSLRSTNDLSDRRRWLTSPTTVNAYYHQQRNLITFPAGILQPSYFHVGHPRYLNYGGIGFMIGHEITHGFDDMGRQYDKEGNLFDWWTSAAADLYKMKGQCVIEQYGNFTDQRAGRNLNAERNQGENIADNGGVKETYQAYRTLIDSNGGKEELLLPGLNFTQNQLFFLSFAQLRCDLTTPDDALKQILSGAHSPNRFRVIGSLQNMPEFSEVFHCPIGSYMNPEKKCAVW